MDSKETHQQQQQNRSAAALASPTSTSQAMHHNRSTVGALSLRQPQPQQTLMLNGSPYSVATQRGGGRPDVNVTDGGDSGGGADAAQPAKRGRPLGSRNKKNRNNALGGGGGSVTAHVIDISAGEDIAMKLLKFIDQEARNVCILSASGAVSSAVLHSHDRLGLVKYEGVYDIIDMSMSATSSNTARDGTLIRTASLHVSLAGPDFNVVGGRVGGVLVAASQVQVIVGTYVPEGVNLSAASSAPANVLSSSGVGGGPGFPQRSSESSEESPLHQVGNSTPQPPHHRPLWPGSNNPQ